MINRRHIRIKVMQSIYAMMHSENSDILKEEKFLKHSIKRLFDLYALNLQFFIELNNLAIDKMEISKKKFLATTEDLKPNTRFVNNPIFQKLKDSNSLGDYIENNKLTNWSQDDEYVKLIFDQLQKSNTYKFYLKDSEESFKSDKEFVTQIFKEFIAPNEKLADYFEDDTISWVDDIPYVNTWIVRSLERLSEKKSFKLGRLYKDEDDEAFVSELFRKTIVNYKEFEKDIMDKVPNWETDRIADLDMILIKMAISEFIHFPSIPVKVTINEYIEIAKDYSTKKSGYFVNGVLDRISKDFLDSKRIVKSGRGLL